MTERSKAFIALIACVFFWGISFVSTKIAGAAFPPMSLGALRFALALVLLGFVKNIAAPGEKLKFRDLPLLLGAALTGVTLYFFFENTGLTLISASEASIIVASIPALTLGAQWLGGKLPGRGKRRQGAGTVQHRIPIQCWLGVIVSIIGVALTVNGGGASLSSAPAAGISGGKILGYLCMAGAALSWVAYCFLSQSLFKRCSRIHIVYWQTVFGFLAFIPFAVFEFPRWGQPDLPIILHTAFLGLCCSALACWFYVRSLEVLGLAVSALFLNFVPVVTVIAGFFILGERLDPVQWAGAALVLAGMCFAVKE